MKFYLLDDPAKPADYASFSHVGTWVDEKSCKMCEETASRLVEPLQIEWDEGSTRIGDFSWCGYHCVVVSAVRARLVEESFECRFGRVEVLPSEITLRPRVDFPYQGPDISWIISTASISVDTQRSHINVVSECAYCGRKRYEFKRDGLQITSSAWNGEKLFRIEQFGRSQAKFMTEEGLGVLRRRQFTNLCPKFAGLIGV